MSKRAQMRHPPTDLLTTEELAQRWRLSEDTLRIWRQKGKGPKFVKFGDQRTSAVRYRLSDVEKYETENLY
ncbi:MAG: hypothetical protein RL148_1641 [Planctomycetota bacterium]